MKFLSDIKTLCKCVLSVSSFRGAFRTHWTHHAAQEAHDVVQELPPHAVWRTSGTADHEWRGQRGRGY